LKKRVFFVTFAGDEGGPQAWFKQVASHPRFRDDVDAHIWMPSGNFKGPMGKLRLFRACRSEYAQAGRIKVVYVSLDLDFGVQIALMLRILGAKTIIMHSHVARFTDQEGFKFRMYRKLAAAIADRKVAVSEDSARGMFGCGLERAKLLPAFVDFKVLWDASNGCSEEAVRSLTAEVEKKFVFACIGRMARNKNMELGIDAFALYRENNRSAGSKLLLVGTGPREESLKVKCAELGIEGDVIFYGWVDNVEVYLRYAVDCLLMPSLLEGAPRVAMEAQAFGCSVIVSEAIPEFCLFREDLATRLNELDAEIWAREMERVARGGKKTIGNGIEIARQHPLFSIDQGIEDFLGLLEPSETP